MDVETALVRFLQTRPSLAALVGERIYRTALPDPAVYPALVVTHVGTSDFPHQQGAGELASTRAQVSAWSRSANEAAAVARAANAEIAPARITSETPGFCGDYEGLKILRAMHTSDVEIVQPPQDAGDRPYVQRALDFEIWNRS